MNLYKKINNYLLHNHPNIWITRIHLFAPIGIAIVILLFCINAFVIGYNTHNNLPDSFTPIALMVVPVLVFLVFWFVFQARYNVEKSGGKLKIWQDYLNYFIYFIIGVIAYLIIISIPLSNDYKVYHAVNKQEVLKDIEVLNLGNEVVTQNYTLSINDNGSYSYMQSNFIDKYHYTNYDQYYYESYIYEDEPAPKEITVTRNELIKLIDNFKLAYNKYTTTDKITQSAETIIKENMNGSLITEYDDYYYYNMWDDDPYGKLYNYQKQFARGWYYNFFPKEAFYILAAVFAMFALAIWIFKQMHWKYYVFGIVSLALTPLLVAIVGVVIFELFDLNESVGFVLVLLTYITLAVMVLMGTNAQERNHTSIVAAMYLQLFLPFLPLFFIALFEDNNWHYIEDRWILIYWTGWILGVASIAAFKYIYKTMRLLPTRK